MDYFNYITNSDSDIDYDALKTIFLEGLAYADSDVETLGIFDSS